MSICIAYTYAVVQFLETPRADVDDYVCVPHSWIRTRRGTDRTTTVVYPDETRSQVEIRMRNCEKPLHKWKAYMAIIKYETFSFVDASCYIMEQKIADSAKKVYSALSIDESSLLATATDKINNSIKRIKLSKPQGNAKKKKIIDKEAEAEPANETSSYKQQVSSQEKKKNDYICRNSQQPCQHDKQIYHKNIGPSQTNLSNSYPHIQGESGKKNKISNSQTGPQGPKRNLLYVSPEPLVLVEKILRDCQQSYENLQNSLGGHLHQNQASAERRQRENISNLTTRSPEILLPQQCIEFSGPSLESSRKKIQIIDKAKFIDQLPKLNNFSEYVNLKSATLSSDNLSEIIMGKSANVTSSFRKQVSLHEEKSNDSSGRNSSQSCHTDNDIPHNHLSRGQTLLDKYYYQGGSGKMNKTQVSNSQSRSQSPKKNLFNISRDPLILKNQILRDYQQSNENLPCFLAEHLQSRPLGERRQRLNILNLTALSPEISHPKQGVQELKENTSSIILNPSKVAKKSHQIPKLLAYHDRPHVLPTQLSPKQPSLSDTELNYQKSIFSNSVERQDSDIQAMAVDQSTEGSCKEKVIHSQRSTENDLALIDYPESVNQSSQSNSLTNMIDLWTNQLSDIFNEMGCNLTNASEVSLKIHQKLSQSAKTIELIKNIFQNIQNRREKRTSLTPKEGTTENDGKNEANQAEMVEEEAPDNYITESHKISNVISEKIDVDGYNNDKDCNDDEEEENEEEMEDPKKFPENQPTRSFILPQEFDPNDTKWTLRYRKNDPKFGLVELMPRSRVYINAIRLSHCKRMSKDSKTLARMILVEIFSQNALSVCSLTGARANAFDGTRVRPGLDEHARLVLMTFVEEHARQKKWGPFDSQSVMNSIRSKIQEIRAKHGKTE